MADQERSWGDALTGLAGAFADSLAGSNRAGARVLGGLMQYGMNTPEYQRQQKLDDLSRQNAEIMLERSRSELERSRSEAPLREQDNKRKFLENQEYTAPEAQQQRTLQRQANIESLKIATSDDAKSLARAQLANANHEAIRGYLGKEFKSVDENLSRMMDQQGMTLAARNEFNTTGEAKRMRDLVTVRRLYEKSLSDPTARRALESYLGDFGGKVIKGQDGVETLAIHGRAIPVTPENFDQVFSGVAKEYEAEAKTRMMLSGSRDNIMTNVLGDAVRSSAAFFENSHRKTAEAFQQHLGTYPEQARYEFLLSSGYRSAMDDGKVTPEEQAALLPQLKAISDKLGTRVHVDQQNPLNSKVEDGSGRLVPVSEFVSSLEQRSTIKKDWEKHLINVARENAKKKTGKDLDEDAAPQRSDEEKAYIDSGMKFAKERGLTGMAKAVWENRGDNKMITQPDDVMLILGRAQQEAEDAFTEEPEDRKAYEKAGKAFRTVLESAGVKSELIPDLWKESDLEEKGKALDKKEREILEKRGELKKSGKLNLQETPARSSNVNFGNPELAVDNLYSEAKMQGQSKDKETASLWNDVISRKREIYEEKKKQESQRKKQEEESRRQASRREQFRGK